MGAAAVLAQDAPDDKRELCTAGLDIAEVETIADEGA